MQKQIEITRENLWRVDFGSVVAITIAAEGAMGEAGGVELTAADGICYHFNFTRGSLSLWQFHSAFPDSPTNCESLPTCWHELYLGVGNCLYLREQIWQKYQEANASRDSEDVMCWLRSVQGRPLLSKEERYRRLVKDAAASYPIEGTPGDMTWCDACRDEINLWTYWQGRGCLAPEILVVGQDWGNPRTRPGEQCLRNIGSGRPYLENNTFPSDQNLAVLFDEALDIDIGTRDGRLFFTNLVLGYRTGKNTGALQAAQYEHDLIRFKSLVNILSPKVVVCLGRNTFTYALRAFGERKSFPDGYAAALDRHENYTDIGNIRFYGMAHCGNYGCKNRGGNVEKGLRRQIEDWKEIAKRLSAS